MRRLTVMLLANDLRFGPAEQQLVDLARELDRERFRIIVATLKSGQPLEDDLRGLTGVEFLSLELRGPWDPVALPRLISLLRREHVDVLQPCTSAATALGLLAGAIARTPVKVATARPGGPAKRPNRIARFFDRRLARIADVVIPNSEAGARAVVERGIDRNRLRVIHDGIAPERLRTNVEERQKLRHGMGVLDESWLIGIAADLTRATDYGSFLQGASIVRAEVPGTKFLIVGDGPLRAELKRRMTLLGLDGSVVMAIHPVRRAPYIAAMDVAVLPSSDDGSSTFVQEAMGLGRPCVTTGDGGTDSLFRSGDAGLVVPPDNPIILAHAILEIMRHPEAVERMRERGREVFREKFALSRVVAAHEDLYTDLWRRYEQSRARGAAETVGGG